MKCVGWKCSGSLVLVLAAILVAAVSLSAQQPPASTATPASSPATPEIPKALSDRLAQLEKDVKAAQSAGDNAWTLVSTTLVLMMTAPGFATFYGVLGA